MDLRVGQPEHPALTGMPGPPEEALGAQLASLFRALKRSPARRRIALIALGLVAVVCLSTVAALRLNSWNGPFYDALQQRNFDAFIEQILVFLLIVSILLTLVVAQTFLNEVAKVALRDWLTSELLNQWLAPRRAYLLGFAGAISENPDQRMQEDVRHLSELTGDLAIGLLQASLQLVTFVGVLWILSADVVFLWHGHYFTIPGYMVWCALGYALLGSFLTWRVGRPLIALNAERYRREAELRFALVRVSESAEAIALYRGEAGERRALDRLIGNVVSVLYALARGLARLTWITSGYGWLALVAPILAASPGYFAGTVSLGALMVMVGAFNQVQQALRWFVDNFSRIADWRATLLRVVALRDALMCLAALEYDPERILIVDHPDGRMAFDRLTVALAGLGNGHAVLTEPSVEIAPGERVLIAGEAGAGKTTMFLAIAGLWPWGSGRILMPPREAIMFMPQRPYLPLGSLSATLAYPAGPERFSADEVKSALALLGLTRLAPSLELAERWDKELSLEEQQALAFVRLALHKPKWVFLDEAMSALDDDGRRAVRALFDGPLSTTTVIATARTGTQNDFYTRRLTLKRLPHGVDAISDQVELVPEQQ